MKQSNKILTTGLMALGLLSGGLLATTTTANASSYSTKRSHSVKLVWRKSMKKHAMHGTKGYLYSKHLGRRYKSLKSYPKTTWYTSKHEKLLVKKDGHSKIYYYVTSGNKKHSGWIWRGYLKSGKNPKATAGKSSNYYANLANKLNKKYANVNDDKSDAKTTNDTKPSATKPTTDKQAEAFDASAVQADILILLNQERTKRGLAPVTLATSVESASQTRANQLVSDFNHIDPKTNDTYIHGLLHQMNVYVPVSEVAGITNPGDTNMDTAQEIIHEYFYDDADSGWGHRGLLSWDKAKKVGIGVTKSGNRIYDVINIYSNGI
ncbi:CAP domain-containing protein [Levilactobacillus tujiorum]|uniref:CAP domain-containing protein n=1 Tax=Levilactobacillus tujiorum TaxID=2912243 RepID=UPI001456C2F7|nr:CAP domain-containing protein [Levilactobacillus tujiorum]NLR32830.1 hypothetical protein [Levilactobacillus tujiorum]